MNFPYKVVLFDWAFTLVDLGQEDDRPAFWKLLGFLKSSGIEISDWEDQYQTYRRLFFKQIDHARDTLVEARFEQVLNYLLISNKVALKKNSAEDELTLERLMNVYYQELYKQRQIYEDVRKTLKILQDMGVLMGIVSNTTNPGSMKEMEKSSLGLDVFFDFAIYSSEVPFRKPHPSIFELAISRSGHDLSDILFVGDNLKADIEGAKGVGLQTAWINRGGASATESVDFEISQVNDILSIDPKSSVNF